jgi:glycosyltransferase involved in cell wall biosynthesis
MDEGFTTIPNQRPTGDGVMAGKSLSVIMPNYNHARFISMALTAILEQSRRPLEVIVIDDGSSDNSLEVIDSFVRRDPIVRLIRHERNQGLMAAVASGVQAARGDYLFIPSADDFILPGFFEKSLRLLEAHPEAGLSFAFGSQFDGATGRVEPCPSDLSSEPCYLAPRQLAQSLRGCIPGHAVIIKRAAFLDAGGYRAELRGACDLFVNHVVGYRCGACYVPECLSLWRNTPASFSVQAHNDRNKRLETLGNFLKLVISAPYRDVLPLFQQSRLMQALGPDVAHAACQSGIDRERDVIALVATLTDEEHALVASDDCPAVRELNRRAILSKLAGQDANPEETLVTLYRKTCDLQLQVRELQNFVDAVRHSAPFMLRRRWAPKLRNLLDQFGRLSMWLRRGRPAIGTSRLL